MLKRLFSDYVFIAALAAAFFVAWWLPAASDPTLNAGLRRLLAPAIMLVFLLQGLSLPGRELWQGLSAYRLHALIQFCIFGLAALWMLGAAAVLYGFGQDGLAAGFVYLALLPTTISSAILFTAAAGGRVSLSLLNTALSNVLAIIWVPLGCWVLLDAGDGSAGAGFTALLWTLVQWILLPLALGQLLRAPLQRTVWLERCKPHFKTISSTVIVCIVFKAFVDLRVGGAWQGLHAGVLVSLVGMALAVVLLTHLSVWWLSGKAVGHDSATRIAILFCGSQKSLATGAPMAVAIFTGPTGSADPRLGLLLLPLLIVHPFQLLLAGMLKGRLRKAEG